MDNPIKTILAFAFVLPITEASRTLVRLNCPGVVLH